MQLLRALGLAAVVATTSAQVLKGFNYGSVNTDNSPITEAQYEKLFNTAQQLSGTSGFTSARLFTTIQAGSANAPTEAIQAAINTKTKLLLGFWASAGVENINNELAALKSAIGTFGSAFTDLVVGLSVGSEDLYRISPTGIINKSGVGAGPQEIVNYINLVRGQLQGTAVAGKPIGHVDTYTAWINGSNSAVVDAVDVVLTDFYPFYQYEMANSIDNAYALAQSAYQQTVAAAKGKPVWVTETGWPVSGDKQGQAEAGVANAKTYWDQVGCNWLFDKTNTFWFTLQDASPATPNPSFGIVGNPLSTTPLFDLSCSGVSSATPSSATAAVPSANPSSIAAGGPGAQGEASAIASGVATAQTGAASASNAPQSSGSSGSSASGSTASGSGSSGSGSSGSGSSGSGSSGSGAQPAGPGVPPTTLITATSAAPAATGSNCPTNLNAGYEFPHLIVPVNKDKPDQAYGTSYNGTITPSISSIFNFDVPASYAGKTCTLFFLFPTQDKLVTSAYSFSGSGGFDVEKLQSPATEQTTYNAVPGHLDSFGGPSSVSPGNEYLIKSGPCSAGQRVAYKVSSTGSLSLNYFQDFNPSPIGLYYTYC